MRDGAEERSAWAWIDLDALRHNARMALARAGDRTVIGVVKANAYGHGAEEIAHGLLAEGVARLAVVSVAEGAELRRSGIVDWRHGSARRVDASDASPSPWRISVTELSRLSV